MPPGHPDVGRGSQGRGRPATPVPSRPRDPRLPGLGKPGSAEARGCPVLPPRRQASETGENLRTPRQPVPSPGPSALLELPAPFRSLNGQSTGLGQSAATTAPQIPPPPLDPGSRSRALQDPAVPGTRAARPAMGAARPEVAVSGGLCGSTAPTAGWAVSGEHSPPARPHVRARRGEGARGSTRLVALLGAPGETDPGLGKRRWRPSSRATLELQSSGKASTNLLAEQNLKGNLRQ